MEYLALDNSTPLPQRRNPLTPHLLILHLPAQLLQHLLSRPQMRLQPVHLLPHRLQILLNALQTRPRAALAPALLEIAQLLALVIQQLLQLALDERGLGVALPAPLARRHLLDLGHLLVQLGQLLLEPHLLPLGVRLRAGEIRARRLEPAAPQTREVLVAKLGLAPRARLLVGLGRPARGGGGAPGAMAVDLVVDLVALEAGAQRGGDGARDAEALVAVVEDVEEG